MENAQKQTHLLIQFTGQDNTPCSEKWACPAMETIMSLVLVFVITKALEHFKKIILYTKG